MITHKNVTFQQWVDEINWFRNNCSTVGELTEEEISVMKSEWNLWHKKKRAIIVENAQSHRIIAQMAQKAGEARNQ